MFVRTVFVCCTMSCLTACASEKLVGRPDLQIVDQLPPPGRGDMVLDQREYLIGPYDRVDISVYGVAELTRTVQVDSSGKIALPLVGELEAAGQTTSQFAARLRTALQKYVRNPQITVSADTVNQMVTVDGQVTKPGLYPVQGRMTLQRAIARAEGTTEFARSNYIVVFRRVNDKSMAALYDLRAIRQGMYEDPEVFANDVIYVGESGGQRLFRVAMQSGAILAAPLVAIVK